MVRGMMERRMRYDCVRRRRLVGQRRIKRGRGWCEENEVWKLCYGEIYLLYVKRKEEVDECKQGNLFTMEEVKLFLLWTEGGVFIKNGENGGRKNNERWVDVRKGKMYEWG